MAAVSIVESIRREIEANGSLSSADIAERLGVSRTTVRLCREGLFPHLVEDEEAERRPGKDGKLYLANRPTRQARHQQRRQPVANVGD
jgi:predicted ArsR family transcriptional regulator